MRRMVVEERLGNLWKELRKSEGKVKKVRWKRLVLYPSPIVLSFKMDMYVCSARFVNS